MEEHTARLEVTVDHIQSYIAEIKGDIRRIDAKVDSVKEAVDVLRTETQKSFAAANESIAALRLETHKSFAAVNESIAALRVEMLRGFTELKVARVTDRIWWFAMAAGLLSVIARAFKWI